MDAASFNLKHKGLKESATLAINEQSQQLIRDGKEVFKFGLGQSPFPVPDHVVAALRDNAHQKDYLPVKGLPPLRAVVSEWFASRQKLEFDPENILIAPGSKELLFLIQMSVDAVLMLPSPSWVSYEPQSQLAGNETLWLDTNEADDWCLVPETLARACKDLPADKKGILLLNSPNNPVGACYGKEHLQGLAEVARQFGILVISDEIYGDIHHQGQHASIASFYPEGTVVTTGLSKWCGAGGWRPGIAAFPQQLHFLANSVSSLASETYTSVSAPIQYAAIKAFEVDQNLEDYLSRSRTVLRTVQSYVRDQLTSMGLTMPEGRGGFYLFCNFERYRKQLSQRQIESSSHLARTLLMETGIAGLPGSAFGRPESELTMRLSYVDFDGEEALKQAELLSSQAVFLQVCPKINLAMDKLNSWLQDL